MCNICINGKIFFLAEILSGCCLGFGYMYFLLADTFHFCSCFRLESSCTRVNMVFISGFHKSINGPMTVIVRFSLNPDHNGERLTDKKAVF